MTRITECFRGYFDTLESGRFMDKTGEYKTMVVEIQFPEMLQPNPFPSMSVYVWPNGKGGST